MSILQRRKNSGTERSRRTPELWTILRKSFSIFPQKHKLMYFPEIEIIWTKPESFATTWMHMLHRWKAPNHQRAAKQTWLVDIFCFFKTLSTDENSVFWTYLQNSRNSWTKPEPFAIGKCLFCRERKLPNKKQQTKAYYFWRGVGRGESKMLPTHSPRMTKCLKFCINRKIRANPESVTTAQMSIFSKKENSRTNNKQQTKPKLSCFPWKSMPTKLSTSEHAAF